MYWMKVRGSLTVGIDERPPPRPAAAPPSADPPQAPASPGSAADVAAAPPPPPLFLPLPPRRRRLRLFPPPSPFAPAPATTSVPVTASSVASSMADCRAPAPRAGFVESPPLASLFFGDRGGGAFGTRICCAASFDPIRALPRFASFTASRDFGPRTGVRGTKIQPTPG